MSEVVHRDMSVRRDLSSPPDLAPSLEGDLGSERF
jgi:hypothetical protein